MGLFPLWVSFNCGIFIVEFLKEIKLNVKLIEYRQLYAQLWTQYIYKNNTFKTYLV